MLGTGLGGSCKGKAVEQALDDVAYLASYPRHNMYNEFE